MCGERWVCDEVYLLEIYDKSEYASVHEGVLKQMIKTLPILGEME